MGNGLEPGADRPALADRLSRRRDDAHQPRGRLPGALRPGPRRAATRADRLPAHRTGAAGAAGANPPRQVLRHARDPDQPASGGGGRPGGAGTLGGRLDHRLEPLGHRHARGAHDALHDAAAPAAQGGLRHRRARQERAAAGRTRCRGGARGDHPHDHNLARAAATVSDLGPGCGDEPARAATDRGRRSGVLLRSPQPVAARHEREHQRAFAPVLPEGHRSQHARCRRPRGRGGCPQRQAAQDAWREDTGRGAGPSPAIQSH
jgi:hypothetical protein